MSGIKLSKRKLIKTQGGLESLAGYLFSLPFVFGFLFFIAVPMMMSLYYSFCDYNIVSPAKFSGFKNYIQMFKDARWLKSLKVTLFYAFVSVPLRVVFALIVAMILNRQTAATSVYRAMYYLPSLLGSSVAVAVLWKRLFANNGLINSLFGLDVKWLGNPKTAIWVLIILSVWQFGSSMLVFLSALKQVPITLYEAAEVDGVGKVRRFFSITLPLITSSAFFNIIMQFINGMLVFASGQIISDGKPLDSTLFYVLYMYKQSFQYNNAGLAVAMGWFLILIVGVFTALFFATKKLWVYEGGY